LYGQRVKDRRGGAGARDLRANGDVTADRVELEEVRIGLLVGEDAGVVHWKQPASSLVGGRAPDVLRCGARIGDSDHPGETKRLKPFCRRRYGWVVDSFTTRRSEKLTGRFSLRDLRAGIGAAASAAAAPASARRHRDTLALDGNADVAAGERLRDRAGEIHLDPEDTW